MIQFPIVLISDGTGETAELMLRAALSQFPDLKPVLLPHRRLLTHQEVEQAVEQALRMGAKIVVSTLVNADLRRRLSELTTLHHLPLVNLLNPVLEAISQVSGLKPIGCPGAQRQINDQYFLRVKAMEYTIACDDGRSPHLLSKADLVIYGVSRAGKTPLSLYLANKGVAVANVPLVPGVEPDPRALGVPVEKRLGLLISPERLREIRSQRLVLMGLDPEKSSYASRESIEKELADARKLMEKLQCRIYESTDQPMEYMAQEILFDFGLADRLLR